MSWFARLAGEQGLLRFPWGRREHVELRHVTEEDPDDIKVEREKGASGTDIFQGSVRWVDYNPLMVGDKFFDTVDKMRLADGSISALLKLLKLPFLRTEWTITTEKPDDPDPQNQLIAKVAQEKLLGAASMHELWHNRLSDNLLMFDFGFSVQEKVFYVDDEGFLRYKRFAPRVARTIKDFKVDDEGQVVEVHQDAFKDGKFQHLVMEQPYLFTLAWEREGDNHWGRSVLRTTYKHWFYKEEMYRIDAVRLDRWGIGIPKAKIMKGYTLRNMARVALEKMLTSLRGNERAWAIHPEEVELEILTPKSVGTDLGLIQSVNHHDMMIFRTALAQFMTTGNQEHGNYGSTRSYADMYLFALQAAANFLQAEFTRQNIKQFCDLNFQMKNRPYPMLRAADIQKIELGLLSEALNKLVGAKLLTPDDDIESFLRKVYGWPKLPKEFTRAARLAKGEDVFGTQPKTERPQGRPTEPNPQPRKVDQRPGED